MLRMKAVAKLVSQGSTPFSVDGSSRLLSKAVDAAATALSSKFDVAPLIFVRCEDPAIAAKGAPPSYRLPEGSKPVLVFESPLPQMLWRETQNRQVLRLSVPRIIALSSSRLMRGKVWVDAGSNAPTGLRKMLYSRDPALLRFIKKVKLEHMPEERVVDELDIHYRTRGGLSHEDSDATLQAEAEDLVALGLERHLGATQPAAVAIIKALAVSPADVFS